MARLDGPLNLLIVEDSDDYVALLTRYLRLNDESQHYTNVASLGDARSALERGGWDIILLDYILEDCTAEEILDLCREFAPEVPVIIVTGTVGEERAADLMRAGADDIVLKDNLARLRPSIERELANAETRHARKRAEGALAGSEERFRVIFEASPSAIALINLDGRYEMVNPAMCEMVGYSAEELTNMNWRDITPTEEFEMLQARTAQVLENMTKNPPIERRFLAKDGSIVWTSMTSGYVPDENGRAKFILGQYQNVTENREVEAKLVQSQKMEAVGQLTGGIAHDFNNLLAVVLGNLQLLDRRVKADDRAAEFVSMATEAVQRGADLTRQLLAFSRGQDLETQVVGVNQLVEGMDLIFRRTLGGHIEVTTHLDPEVGWVKADPAQLESALLNLAINARDAMLGGGKLIIETMNADLDDNYVRKHPYAQTGPHVCISVCDTGTGISKQDLDRIFEPFFTTKEVGKGTGIGLSMVYGFVKQSGGHINVYSEQGQGTRFRIYLPRSDEAGAEFRYRGDRKAPGVPVGRETVLVVEDQDSVRETTKFQLEELGYSVVTVADGPSALEVLESDRKLDLVFTDMVMPGNVNGLQLATRATELRADIAILLTSGYPRDALVGGSHYPMLSKPYTMDELAVAIRDVLDRGPIRDDADG